MSIKEIWSKLKYWQKGGMIAGVFGVFVPSIFGLASLIPLSGKTPTIIRLVASFIGSPIALLWGPIHTFLTKISLVETLGPYFIFLIISLLSFIPYFVVGAAFGQLYYERKNPAPIRDISRIFSWLLTRLIITLYLALTFFTFLIFLGGEI